MNFSGIFQSGLSVLGGWLGSFGEKADSVGIDVGSSALKIAQRRNGEKGPMWLKTESREFSGEDGLAEALRGCLAGVDVAKARFTVSINCPQTALRRVVVPAMPREDLRRIIRLEGKNYFPFPTDEAWVDFEIAEEFVESGTRKYALWVAASSRRTVERVLSLLEKAGIKPACFIPAPIAFKNFAAGLPGNLEETRAFLDIGKNYSELTIFKGGILRFSRKIPVAGDDFTKAMTVTLISERGKVALTQEEAEVIKKEIGLPVEGEPRVVREKITTMQILSMLRPAIEQLASEIDRCFDYYREEALAAKIDSLILSGGGAELKGLAVFLSRELGLEVRGLDTLKAAGQDVVSGRVALASGAALDKRQGINLLPPETREKAARAFLRTAGRSIAVVVALIAIFLYGGMKMQLGKIRKDSVRAKEELAVLDGNLKSASEQSLVNAILADEPYWEDVLRDLSHVIPDQVRLTELQMGEKYILMKGVIVGEEREKKLSSFMLALEKAIFKGVKLVMTREIREQSINEFELKCWVD